MNLGPERRWIESEEQNAVNRNGQRLAAREVETSYHREGVDVTATRRGRSSDYSDDQIKSDSDSDDGNTGGLTDLFADPDPLDTFLFRFDLDRGRDHDEGDNGGIGATSDLPRQRVEISLLGYKAELGQTLHSTGLTLWRASSLLSDFLVQNPSYIRQQAVVELGAGLGLCGILASHLQPSKVILTDGDTNALKYLRANVKRNLPLVGDVLTTGATSSSRTTVMVRQLIWGETISFMSGDQDAFDTVLGSDIIYVEEILEPLWRTISRLLAPDGAFLLAFARRNVPIDRVFEVADANGFVWVVDDSKSEGVVVFRRSKGR